MLLSSNVEQYSSQRANATVGGALDPGGIVGQSQPPSENKDGTFVPRKLLGDLQSYMIVFRKVPICKTH